MCNFFNSGAGVTDIEESLIEFVWSKIPNSLSNILPQNIFSSDVFYYAKSYFIYFHD